MMRRRSLVALVALIFFGACACRADAPDDASFEINEIDDDGSSSRERHVHNRTLAEIFENAVQAYLEEDWDGCITGFEDALRGYVGVVETIRPLFRATDTSIS